jgi:hypothetical protein
MTIEVHGAPMCDMDHFIRECGHLFHNRCDMDNFIRKCVHFFHDRQSKYHLSLSFCIQFFSVSIVF